MLTQEGCMDNIHLYESNYLDSLTHQLSFNLQKERDTQDDPFTQSHIVYPNKIIFESVKWALMGDRSIPENCLMGVTSDFVSGILDKLVESLGFERTLPRSEELQWGIISHENKQQCTLTNSNPMIRVSDWNQARVLAELLFRQPTQVPSVLLEDSDLCLPNQTKLASLWKQLSLMSEEVLGNSTDPKKQSTPREEMIKSFCSLDPLKLDVTYFTKTSSIHLFAPKALSISLLRLLKSIAQQCDLYIYMLSAKTDHFDEADPFKNLINTSDLLAFTLNLKLVQSVMQVPSQPCLIDQQKQSHDHQNVSSLKVEFHSCTHDARQVDALYERINILMRAAPKDDPLNPHDFLILVNDMSRFMPYIRRRFQLSRYINTKHLSAVVYDRNLNDDNPYANLLNLLCKLPRQRLNIEQIFEIFEMAPVSLQFPIDEERRERLKDILDDLNLKWGLDSQDRKRFSHINSALHTWRFALERLMLSELVDQTYCSANRYLDIIKPSSPLGKADYQTLSTFLSFLHTVESLIREFPGGVDDEGASYLEWQKWLLSALDRLSTVDATDQESRMRLYTVKQAINQIKQWIENSSVDGVTHLKMNSHVVSAALNDALRTFQSTQGKQGNSVIFSPLSLGAGYPAKVLMFLGMEEGQFPSSSPLLSFDPLNRKHPKRLELDLESLHFHSSHDPQNWQIEAALFPGLIASERASFITALLNAKRQVCIFWNGEPQFQYMKQHKPCAPVNELIRSIYNEKEDQAAHMIHHPISPYSPQAFFSPTLPKAENIESLLDGQTLSRNQIEKWGAFALSNPLPTSEQVSPIGYNRRKTQQDETSNQDLEHTQPISLDLIQPSLSKINTYPLYQLAKAIKSPMEKFLQKAGYKLTYAKGSVSPLIPSNFDGLQKYSVRTQLVQNLIKLWQPMRSQEIQTRGHQKSLLSAKGSVFRKATYELYEQQYKELRANGVLGPGALGRSMFEMSWYESQRYFWDVVDSLKEYQSIPIQHTVMYQAGSSQLSIPLSIYQAIKSDETEPPPPLLYSYTLSKKNSDHIKISPWIEYLAAKHAIDQGDLPSHLKDFECKLTAADITSNTHKSRIDPSTLTKASLSKTFSLDQEYVFNHQEDMFYFSSLEQLLNQNELILSGNEGALRSDSKLSNKLRDLNSLDYVRSEIESDYHNTFQTLQENAEHLFGSPEFYQSRLNPSELDEDFIKNHMALTRVFGVFK
jgi:exonuclease V gamma subunit